MRNKFFRGTYGWDRLSKFLLIIGAVLIISKYTFILGAVIVIYAFIRTLSKNFEKREREEQAFENSMRGVSYNIERLKYRYRSWRYRFEEKRKYVIVKCPNCSQKLRLPRHKGRVLVKCKRCSCEFKSKT